jgi:hypothetical protein
VTGSADDQALEAFYSDSNGTMTFSAHREDLALDVVEWFVRKARELLPRVYGDADRHDRVAVSRVRQRRPLNA